MNAPHCLHPLEGITGPAGQGPSPLSIAAGARGRQPQTVWSEGGGLALAGRGRELDNREQELDNSQGLRPMYVGVMGDHWG